MRRLTVAVLLLAGLVSLSACNTAEGFGEDLSQLGNAIERKAGDDD